MVGTHRVDYFWMFAILFAQFHTQQCVWCFLVGIRHFADIVQQTGAFGQFHVESHFCGHGSAQAGYFAAVFQQVLPETATEAHTAYIADEFGV